MLPWKCFENFTYCNGHINSDGGSISKVGGPKAMTRFPSPTARICPVHM